MQQPVPAPSWSPGMLLPRCRRSKTGGLASRVTWGSSKWRRLQGCRWTRPRRCTSSSPSAWSCWRQVGWAPDLVVPDREQRSHQACRRMNLTQEYSFVVHWYCNTGSSIDSPLLLPRQPA